MAQTFEQLPGIRGWLILLAIGIIGTPGFLANSVEQSRHLYAMPVIQSYITQGTVDYDPSWRALAIIEINVYALMIIPAVILIFLFFFKHRSFLTAFSTISYLMMCLTIARLYLFLSLATVAQSQKNAFLVSSIVSLLMSSAWLVYVFRSKRVQITFTRRFYLWPVFPFFRSE